MPFCDGLTLRRWLMQRGLLGCFLDHAIVAHAAALPTLPVSSLRSAESRVQVSDALWHRIVVMLLVTRTMGHK